LKDLSSREGVELFVSHEVNAQDAPFEDGQFAWMPRRLAWRSQTDLDQLDRVLREFQPDIMVIASWHIPAYRNVARKFANRCWRVMAMDNGWLGTLRQRLGTLIAPVFVKPLAESVWLPGERQATFARKLGFAQSSILRGLYTCDQPAFAAVHNTRIRQCQPLPRRFAFVGRMVRAKCIDKLAEAYAEYRRSSPDPWPLICCGSGPMRSRLENQEGICMEGFVQPEKMPQVLASIGCLVLPSRFEPWALVVHEAASAGRLILASENVGAVTHLVQPGYNGCIFNSNEVSGLVSFMFRLSAMSDAELDQMSRASYSLSQQFSPKQWSDTLLGSYYARPTKIQ
jgi:glycosyltransferase involved in cell wall biosynthesis